MAADADLVNCERLADEGAKLQRTYELGDLSRLESLLAEPRGAVGAAFAFAKLPSGRPGVTVTVQATPQVVCQRCMRGFCLPVLGGSDIEFAADDEILGAESEREFFRSDNGLVSLRALVEEELLLAMPIAPACSTPLTCGNAPNLAAEAVHDQVADGMRRPFGALQDLLKKTQS